MFNRINALRAADFASRLLGEIRLKFLRPLDFTTTRRWPRRTLRGACALACWSRIDWKL